MRHNQMARNIDTPTCLPQNTPQRTKSSKPQLEKRQLQSQWYEYVPKAMQYFQTWKTRETAAKAMASKYMKRTNTAGQGSRFVCLWLPKDRCFSDHGSHYVWIHVRGRPPILEVTCAMKRTQNDPFNHWSVNSSTAKWEKTEEGWEVIQFWGNFSSHMPVGKEGEVIYIYIYI